MERDLSIDAPLYVVVTDFNGWQQTQVCLQRLQQSSFTNYKVIVVDHGTDAATAAGIGDFPACTLLRGNPELWWTGATNLGIREALARGAEYVMLLNNDCYVDESTLATLMHCVAGEDSRIVAPIQRDPATGDVLVARLNTCFLLGFPTVQLPYMRRLPTSGAELLSTALIGGGRGVVIPAPVFDRVGLFDEKALPHYWADHDFYFRCRASGISLFLARNASVAVDDTRSTTARNMGAMTWREFRASLYDTRSHRNVSALKTLFRRYYPLKLLYPLGLTLNLARYSMTYCLQRIAAAARRLI